MSKDLRNQVQKAGVAAAKASATDLQVLGKGFKLGQAANKGPTSVVEAQKRRTAEFGGKTFLTPFKTNGFYVEDAGGTTVCEARDKLVANELINILNDKFKS